MLPLMQTAVSYTHLGIDDRLVAIYARKSRITNKGDSIGVQFKQSADYAINQLSLPEDYEFARYEDKGCLLYTSLEKIRNYFIKGVSVK